MAYLLYDELFWNDGRKRKHECEITRFETLEAAVSEMEYLYHKNASGNKTSILQNHTAMIIHHDKEGMYDHMNLYGIMEEA